jgi:hypothetical protein
MVALAIVFGRAALYHANERDLDEGEGHRGRSAMIDLIARRPEI